MNDLLKKGVYLLFVFMLSGFVGSNAGYGKINKSDSKSLATGKAKKNALYQHASPYLDMHGRDPVRWQEWNEKTINRARKENKLLFVSSGYFSCHWCHVMQRESYQNEEVAKLLNKYFIPVKVDRELNSALDALLIDFTERTQGAAGWPLNVFITPEGYPLVGMTYVPPNNFIKILELLNQQWQKESANVKSIARSASIELSNSEVATSIDISTSWIDGLVKEFVKQSLTNADELSGGFGQENKFPNVPKLRALLEIYARNTSNDQIKQFLLLTLDKMASQGLWDQLGGGFYRYAVDPNWQVPHFEKMLYDNALLAALYYRAADVFNQPRYAVIADQTLEFMLRDMDTSTSAFAASLSAVDDKGVEGGYYIWTDAELKKNLSANEFEVISEYWGANGSPDLEGGHHFVQVMNITALAREKKMSTVQLEQVMASATAKLRKLREKRVLPKDEKILTAWNALTLSAFVAGAKRNKNYQHSADGLVKYFKKYLWDAKKKVLYRARSKQGVLGEGTLEDYAYTVQALFAWWQLQKNNEDKQLIEQIINQAWQRFYGDQGWMLAENMLLKYGSGKSIISDGPLPSPSSVLIDTTYRFARVTGNKRLEERALKALNVGQQSLQRDVFYYAEQVSTLLNLHP